MTIVYAIPGDSVQQWDGACLPGWIKMATERPGDGYIAAETGVWVEKPAVVPSEVSRYQVREAMRLMRYPKEGDPKWSLFDAFVALMNDPATPAYYRRAWDEVQAFEYGSAMLNAGFDVLGVSPGRRDAVFRLAATLKA